MVRVALFHADRQINGRNTLIVVFTLHKRLKA